jgi:hypothetical protein
VALPTDRGILLPFRVTPGASDIVGAYGDDLRRERTGTILGTRASSGQDTGEVLWDPARGARFDLLRHSAASDAVGDIAVVYAGEAFGQISGERLSEVAVIVDAETILLEVTSVPTADPSPAARAVTAKTTIKR